MASSQTSFSHLWFLLFSISIFLFTSNNNVIAEAAATLDKVIIPPFTSMYMPVKKDDSTLQYFTEIQWGSRENFFQQVIDLGGEFLSLPCDNEDKSKTYRPIKCGSTKCRNTKKSKLCRSPNDTCSVSYYNPFNNYSVITGGLSEDYFVAIPTDGDKLYRIKEWKRTNDMLPFSCVNSSDLKGLARGIYELAGGRKTAMIGFGATKMSFVKNLAASFKLAPKFAICLTSVPGDDGVVFVGGGPYYFGAGPFYFEPPKNASKWLIYTPLIINSYGEYFMGVKSIKIDKRVVHFDNSLLCLTGKTGVGGTKISTTTPYAVLHTSIYKAFVEDFVKRAAARNITRVEPVMPFGACFSTNNIHWSKAGPRVPVIDLELEGSSTNTSSVKWTIYGADSMVKVNKNVTCLGFIDGGSKAKTSIVIGGLQLEDNLLEFDLKTKSLGFTSSFLPRDTKCSENRFTFPDDD